MTLGGLNWNQIVGEIRGLVNYSNDKVILSTVIIIDIITGKSPSHKIQERSPFLKDEIPNIKINIIKTYLNGDIIIADKSQKIFPFSAVNNSILCPA